MLKARQSARQPPFAESACRSNFAVDITALLRYNLPMTNLLLKLFVKNSSDVTSSEVRQRVGNLSGIVGIVLNLLLAAAKVVTGAIFGVLSVLADGVNNFTDCGSNVVSLISIKLANKPADSRHPYGHKRMEYIASMIVALIVLVLAVELATESISKVVQLAEGQAEQLVFSYWTAGALALSVVVKLWMFLFNRTLAKRYNYELLKATATDSVSDVCATGAVLAAVIISHFAGINLDGVMGLAVSAVIAVAGVRILKDTVNQLLGEAPSEELISQITQRIKNFDGVLGIHDLNVHNYGPDLYYASVHVEVDSAVDVMQSHDLLDRIERDFAENTNIVLVTHLDPIVLGDPELDKYKKEVTDIVKGMDEHFDIHDFRMVKGPTHVNLIFDVAVHFDTKLTAKQITEKIRTEIRKTHPDVFVVPTVEKQLKPEK